MKFAALSILVLSILVLLVDAAVRERDDVEAFLDNVTSVVGGLFSTITSDVGVVVTSIIPGEFTTITSDIGGALTTFTSAVESVYTQATTIASVTSAAGTFASVGHTTTPSTSNWLGIILGIMMGVVGGVSIMLT